MVIIKSFTATVIGGLLVLSFEPFDLWYLSPFFLAGLWRLLVLESPKNTFVISFFFGLSLWVLGAGWVENSIVNYGGASKLTAYTFVFLIAIINPLSCNNSQGEIILDIFPFSKNKTLSQYFNVERR